MTQKITFGLELDGERGFRPRNALGESVVGPLGMLAILETQLGLGGRLFSRAERVIAMRQCLQAASTGSRFFERSFHVDELGTASTLLSWRDEWYEHGWDGRGFAKGSARLQDMREIERLAVAVRPGTGQRLMAIEAALQEVRPALSVELATPLEELPLRWRNVMNRLEAVPAPPLSPAGRTGTALRALQEALLAKGDARPKVALRDDGSVRIARSETDIAAAEWLASRLANTPASTLLVGDRNGALLDASLHAFDHPLLGAAAASGFRPPLQLIQLALRLIWAPINYPALLQFLVHSAGPIHPRARRMLAEYVASTPGFGGAAWQRLREDIATAVGFDVADKAMADITFWLEGERWSAAEEAPIAAIRDRVRRLAEFFRVHLNGGDVSQEAAWASAYSTASALDNALKGLEEQGATRVGREFLDRLVWDVTGSGSSNPLLQPTAGAFGHVSDPAAVLEPFERVVWWQMAPTALRRRHPWSRAEILALRESGVALPDLGEKLEAQARNWLRPILAAKDELLLMLPKAGMEVHPVWLQVQACVDGATLCEEAVEEVLGGKDRSSRHVAHRPLPAVRRWWNVAPVAGLLAAKHMSFSGLNKLLFDPFEWVLRYPAKLKESRLLEMSGDALLYGNLAHAAVEQLYGDPACVRWPREKVLAWFDGNFHTLISEQGAVLIMPGKRADLEDFRTRLRESIACLHDHLKSAKIVSVETEREFKADTALGPLEGRVDLLVTRKDGRQAVIDLKWSYSKWYRDVVSAGEHLQLAVYGKLVEAETGAWPAAAYYLFPKHELIPATDGFFTADPRLPGEAGSLAAVWERAVATFTWRREQLDAGRIEVVHEGAEPDDASKPPETGFAMPEPNHRYDPYVHLAGWAVTE